MKAYVLHGIAVSDLLPGDRLTTLSCADLLAGSMTGHLVRAIRGDVVRLTPRYPLIATVIDPVDAQVHLNFGIATLAVSPQVHVRLTTTSLLRRMTKGDAR